MVKHAVLNLRALVGIIACLTAGCGYRTLGTGPVFAPASLAPLDVRAPYPSAAIGVMEGVRQTLGRSDALKRSGPPTIQVELLRVDETPTAIAAPDPLGGGQPFARGTALGVVGRARLLAADGSVAHDTGDVRRVVRYAPSPDPRREQLARDEALRMAGRSLGSALARSLLGYPIPANEPM